MHTARRPLIKTTDKSTTTGVDFKGAMYRIWCGVNRLGDSGVKVV